MNNINFIFVIAMELLLAIALLIILKKCDKRVIELQDIVEKESKSLIESIKTINKELIKLNLILDKFQEIRKKDWLKIISKMLDLINIILILAPIGKKISLGKKLFSIKSMKSIISLVR